MIMLFHDAVFAAVEGTHETLVPVGVTERYLDVFSHRNAEVVVCKSCAMARGITANMLVANCRLGGMNDFHAHVALDGCKAVCF